MKIVIEILLCAIVIAGAVLGVKKGFVSIMAKPIKVIASLILSFVVCQGVADALVIPVIEGPITNYITEFLYTNCSGLTPENVAEELPTLLKISAAIFNVDINSMAAESGDLLNNIVSKLTMPVIEVVSVIFAFVISLIIFRILMWVLFGIIDFAFKGGIFGVLNKTLGLVFGTTLSFVAAWAVAILLEFIFHAPIFEANELISNFEGGFFYNFFNTYSPIELLLSF